MPDHVCNDEFHGTLTTWRRDNTEPLLQFNAAIIDSKTPQFLVAEQLDTGDSEVVRSWVHHYLSYTPQGVGDVVFDDAGQALSSVIVHPRSSEDVAGAVILAHHFTRAQYATFQVNKETHPDLIAELTSIHTRSSREALQMMTDLAFDADANGLSLTTLFTDDEEPAQREKNWIDIYTHCISLLTSPLPVCVLDPSVSMLMDNRSVVTTNMSAFRRPLLSMVTDSLWMLVSSDER